jgi:CRISPR-associated protein Cas1
MKAKSISRIVEIESIAARVYWGTLSTIKIQFKQKDTHEIPEHWTTFSSRQSLLSLTSNRNASNPANALLNYLYALLYAETRFGLLKAGLDPMAGVIHADNQYHDSFVFDVMEPLRPDVDEWLLEFVQNHKFSVKDFYEKRDGGIRLTLKITPFLAENRVPGRNEIA